MAAFFNPVCDRYSLVHLKICRIEYPFVASLRKGPPSVKAPKLFPALLLLTGAGTALHLAKEPILLAREFPPIHGDHGILGLQLNC